MNRATGTARSVFPQIVWDVELDENLLIFNHGGWAYFRDLGDPQGTNVRLSDNEDSVWQVGIGEGYLLWLSSGFYFEDRDWRLHIQSLDTGEYSVISLFTGLDRMERLNIDVGDGWAMVNNGATQILVRLDDLAVIWTERPEIASLGIERASLHGKNLTYVVGPYPLEFRQEVLPSGIVQEVAPAAVNQSVVVLDTGPAADVSPESSGSPARFELHGSYPNPLRGTTTIAFDMPHATAVDLRIYDASGRLVKTLVSDRRESGLRHVHWDGRDSAGRPAAAGVYFYRLEAGEVRETRKLVRLK
jgi:hypothetical protein